MDDAINTVISLVENHPMALLVMAMMVVVVWLSRRLIAKDKIIAGMTSALLKAHSEGVQLDEKTQFTIGVKKDCGASSNK